MYHNPVHPHGVETPVKGHGKSQAEIIAMSIEHDRPLHEHGHGGESRVPVHYPRKTGRGALIFAIVVAAALLVAFIVGHRSRAAAELSLANTVAEEASQPVPVDVIHVQHAPAAAVLALPGRASAWDETTLYSRVNGYVKDFYKDIGARVKAGEVLATIETPDVDDQYASAVAKVNELKAEENVAKSVVDFAQVSFKRWEAAVPAGVVAVQERDQKKSELEEAQAKLKAAEAQVVSGQAEVNRLKTLMEFKDVTAPFDGVITAREVDKGTLVTPGSTTNTAPLFTVAKYDTVRVYVEVPEAAVPDIRNGMDVSVQAREYPGREFGGRVATTSAAIDPATKTLKVEVDVPNPKLELLPGMFVMSTFRTSRAHPPLRVPAAGLTFGPSGAEVAVIGAKNRIRFQPVTIGRDLGNEVEIASGLTGNETIALNVGSQVANGDKVDPHDIDETNVPQPPTMHPQATTAAAVVPGKT
ncbi:MAG TPA: efflux RND transporter periplasmic adaptor subunit, partial [Tepidisphaeraceae bacterium]|nr:efflux RND transporter periplasmic adaptor subunit [Tepidisphaeraceae bacterium]